MIAEAKFRHNGKWLKRNDKFVTDTSNGEDLRALGFARKDEEAEDEKPEEEVESAVAPQRRTFRHRAMKPEE